jgi:excinuclease ABC subunit C
MSDKQEETPQAPEQESTPQAFDHQTFLKSLSTRPGIYQMLDAKDKVIYVGKAKNLKNRVSSYFRSRGLNNKTVALVSKIQRIDVTVTTTETEALILEQNLIKQYMPQYNILLKDNKSYPYIFLSEGDFPRLSYHRGAKRAKGQYFGPYPSASSVRESMNLLQKVFKVRQCEDSYYANRSRACLQYQIKRCTGPCVDHVTKEEYEKQVEHTRMFLQGKSDELMKDLADDMERAAEDLAYEEAAEYRDQIQALQKVTETQFIESGASDWDVIAASIKSGVTCIHALYIRGGRILGSKSFYPKLTLDANEQDLLQAFIAQYYIGGGASDFPQRIVCSHDIEDGPLISEALYKEAGKKVNVGMATKGKSQQWISLAKDTAQQNLRSRLASKEKISERFASLQQVLGLDELPERVECFDISHSSGEATSASCVVFDINGAVKSDYRKFNIENITGGDDYAAMEQALRRRFKRAAEGEGKIPTILLIDGGKGQITQARNVLADYCLNQILVIGIAKGPTRKAGLETLILEREGEVLDLPADSPALHLMQQVRDESHRFAVKAHTARRDKARSKSMLEGIPGVGAKRRKELLRYFGSSKAITEAPVRELIKVPGISEKVAEDIYAYFHKGLE